MKVVFTCWNCKTSTISENVREEQWIRDIFKRRWSCMCPVCSEYMNYDDLEFSRPIGE